MGVDNFYSKPGFYSLTKLICENFAETYNYNFKNFISIIKLSNVFGPYSSHKTSVVHSFIKKIIKNKPLLIHGSGRQFRDFIFVGDVCKKIFKILRDKQIKNKINLNTNKSHRILEIKNILDSISNKNNKIKKIIAPKGYDTSIYKKKLLKDQKYLFNNLLKTYKWYSKNYRI